ncbi:hypothetical protein ACIBXA_01310 [Micromonospora echinaurantiaca]|uniref:hypothetical protein n=1 Tax=Micromonospora echinaurantiaca TaxID=47857 RepID=UPI00379783D5
MLRRVGEGSLDAHTRHTAAEHGPDAAARKELDLLRWLPSPRGWWRLAWTPEGELVGITVPVRNHGDPIVGFVGVLPEQRGHGYAYDLLVETTRWRPPSPGPATRSSGNASTWCAVAAPGAGYPGAGSHPLSRPGVPGPGGWPGPCSPP